MISFKNYISQDTKKFVCLKFSSETNESLRQYAKSNGFNLSVNYNGKKQDEEDFDFHITVYYTWNRVKTPIFSERIEPFTVSATKLDLLGKNKDIPVLKLKAEGDLKSIRDWFTNMGFKDSWPSWKPHVSLSYEKKKYDLSNIKLPDFPLTVTNLTVENQ